MTDAVAAQDAADAAPAETAAPVPVPETETDAASGTDRKRLEEQLEALKRKESELRRALIVADHPELAEAIRTIQGRAFTVGRAEEKLAQGFSKSEARRRETIEKKLGALREKRTELDTQIEALELEHHGLGTDRLATFQGERRQALEQLMLALSMHDAALSAVGVDAHGLVPELTRWRPELEAIAKELSARS